MTWPGHAVLLLPVPPLEEWVKRRTAFYDATFVSHDPGFAHAHLTVFAPFPAERVDVAAQLAREFEPFEFNLTHLDVFPDGIIHLVPEPSTRLVEMMRRVGKLLPDIEPYWGRIPQPPPHVTLDALSDEVTLASTASSIGELPVQVRADHMLLTWWQSGNCHVIAEFALDD